MEGQMTAFEKWNGFIEQLIYFECPADNEKSRLQAELALIEKTNSAEVFQAIYDAWLLLIINGIPRPRNSFSSKISQNSSY